MRSSVIRDPSRVVLRPTTAVISGAGAAAVILAVGVGWVLSSSLGVLTPGTVADLVLACLVLSAGALSSPVRLVVVRGTVAPIQLCSAVLAATVLIFGVPVVMVAVFPTIVIVALIMKRRPGWYPYATRMPRSLVVLFAWVCLSGPLVLAGLLSRFASPAVVAVVAGVLLSVVTAGLWLLMNTQVRSRMRAGRVVLAGTAATALLTVVLVAAMGWVSTFAQVLLAAVVIVGLWVFGLVYERLWRTTRSVRAGATFAAWAADLQHGASISGSDPSTLEHVVVAEAVSVLRRDLGAGHVDLLLTASDSGRGCLWRSLDEQCSGDGPAAVLREDIADHANHREVMLRTTDTVVPLVAGGIELGVLAFRPRDGGMHWKASAEDLSRFVVSLVMSLMWVRSRYGHISALAAMPECAGQIPLVGNDDLFAAAAPLLMARAHSRGQRVGVVVIRPCGGLRVTASRGDQRLTSQLVSHLVAGLPGHPLICVQPGRVLAVFAGPTQADLVRGVDALPTQVVLETGVSDGARLVAGRGSRGSVITLNIGFAHESAMETASRVEQLVAWAEQSADRSLAEARPVSLLGALTAGWEWTPLSLRGGNRVSAHRLSVHARNGETAWGGSGYNGESIIWTAADFDESGRELTAALSPRLQGLWEASPNAEAHVWVDHTVAFSQGFIDTLSEFLTRVAQPAHTVTVIVSGIDTDIPRARAGIAALQEIGVTAGVSGWGRCAVASALVSCGAVTVAYVSGDLLAAVQATGCADFVQAAIATAHAGGVRVHAPHVVDENTATLLRDAGVDSGDGRGWSRLAQQVAAGSDTSAHDH